MKTHLVDATDLFFQCIVIEILRVEVLVEWSLCFNGSEVSRMPGILDIPTLLDFTDAVLRKRGVSSAKSLIQEQYLINDNFKVRQILRSFFEYVQKELPSWLARQVDRDIGGSEHHFSETNKLLTKFVNNGIVDSYHKQPFHCQHMLLNFNEVVDQFPFGAPVTPVVGFGGNFGAQLLQDKEFKSNDPVVVRNVMNNLLANYCGRSKSELLLLGLKKKGNGKHGVVVIINGRPLGVCDPEHGCCIQYPVLERESGGSKGMSNQPMLSSTFCHPIKSCTFKSGGKVARKALSEFQRLVDTDKWNKPVDGDATDSDGEATDSDSEDETMSDSDDKSIKSSESETDDDNVASKSETDDENVASVVDNGRLDLDDDDNSRSTFDEEKTSEAEDFQQSDELMVGVNDLSLDLDRASFNFEDEKDNSDMIGQIGRLEATGRSLENTEDDMRYKKKHSATDSEEIQRNKFARNDSHVSLFSTRDGQPRHLLLTSDHTRGACNLMLAMIYGNYGGTPETIANATEGTSQLRRDTARCVAAEIHGKKHVYTLDNREATDHPSRPGRHITQDLFKIDLNDPTMKVIKGRVSQICLDYFWFQGAYWAEKLNATFFKLSLPKLHDILQPSGTVYLGLSVHLMMGVLVNWGLLKELFQMSLVHESEVMEIDLVAGSHLISEEVYADVPKMGGKDRESERLLGTNLNALQQNYEGAKRDLKEQYKQLAGKKNPLDCRFIKLQKRK